MRILNKIKAFFVKNKRGTEVPQKIEEVEELKEETNTKEELKENPVKESKAELKEKMRIEPRLYKPNNWLKMHQYPMRRRGTMAYYFYKTWTKDTDQKLYSYSNRSIKK